MGAMNREGTAPGPKKRADPPVVSFVRWWSRKDMARWKKAVAHYEIDSYDSHKGQKPSIAMEEDGHLLIRQGLVVALWRRIRVGLPQARDSQLHRPPGYGLLWFADFFYSRKSVEECLRPTIQDLQDEYAEALAANRLHKARWVRIRGTWSFACAAGLLTLVSIGKRVGKLWRAVG
jgi:hypothetical protein